MSVAITPTIQIRESEVNFMRRLIRRAAIEISFDRALPEAGFVDRNGFPITWESSFSPLEFAASGWPDDIDLGIARIRAARDLARIFR